MFLQELMFWCDRVGSTRESPAPFHAAPIVVQFGATTLSTSPISKLGAADDQRYNNFADKLTVEAKALPS